MECLQDLPATSGLANTMSIPYHELEPRDEFTMAKTKTIEKKSNGETIVKHELVEGLETAFLDYSMSVIVQRALPDVRDGLKPVHRRILYAMYSGLGLYPNKPFQKCAQVVGEVLGKYHPHGDSSVYDALVRLAQDFSMHEPLVHGQGNFGSIDGDNAAAYRYTEAKLSEAAMRLLEDIEKSTVDFRPTFDDQREEPVVLPSRLPNLMLNGSEGIAVGMATKVPPHNLRELSEVVAMLCDNPSVEEEELLSLVKGPDFPTGGMVLKNEELQSFYRTGTGKMTLRAKAHTEDLGRGKTAVVFTEIPYGIYKGTIFASIIRLIKKYKDGKKKTASWIDSIVDLRDESDREGIRVVVELRKDADAEAVLRGLYKKTSLQQTYGGILLALVNGEPKVLTFKRALEEFVKHRLEVLVRRTEHDLEKARARVHILDGLLVAVTNIDKVVDIIKRSRKRETAHDKLKKEFDISDLQAKAILDLRLANLTGLDIKSLKEEHAEKRGLISGWEKLLESPEEQRQMIKLDVQELAETHGRARRTRIISKKKATDIVEQVVEQRVSLAFGADGEVAVQALGGRRKAASDRFTVQAQREQDLIAWTDEGMAYKFSAAEVGGSRKLALPGMSKDANVLLVMHADEIANAKGSVMFISEGGKVKRTSAQEYSSPRSGGLNAAGVDEGDRLIRALYVEEEQKVLLASSGGKAICFEVSDVPEQGRTARGVKGMGLGKGERVVGASIFSGAVVVLSENGLGKQVPEEEFPTQGRGGKGVKLAAISKKTGDIAWAESMSGQSEIHVAKAGAAVVSVNASDLPVMGRPAQGQQVVDGKVESAWLTESRAVGGEQ